MCGLLDGPLTSADCTEEFLHFEKFVAQDLEEGLPDSGKSLREGCKKSKWKFKMAFAIRRLTPPPPPLMAKFPDIFSPHFFSFATESYIRAPNQLRISEFTQNF